MSSSDLWLPEVSPTFHSVLSLELGGWMEPIQLSTTKELPSINLFKCEKNDSFARFNDSQSTITVLFSLFSVVPSVSD